MNGDDILALADELGALADELANKSQGPDIPLETSQNLFLKSRAVFQMSLDLRGYFINSEVAEIGRLSAKLDDINGEMKEEIDKLAEIGLHIQEAVAIVQIAANIAQIAAKLGKFAA